MEITGNTYRVLNIASWVLIAALVVTFVVLCVAVSKKNATIRMNEAEMESMEQTIDSLKKDVKTLGAMDAITVNCEFTMNNKTVLGVNAVQANNIAKSYAVMTRQEILDSIYRSNGNIQQKAGR